MKKLLFVVSAFLAFNNFPSTASAQGSLTPPGAPAPVMKSLDQIEARTPVDAVHTPGTLVEGLALSQFTLSQPGSYYLTGNITGVSNQVAIAIVTNDVMLDLNGFSLLGNSNALEGIFIGNSVIPTNITVRNGTISGWGGGNAVYVSAVNVTLEHLTVSGNNAGLTGGSQDMTIRDCTVTGSQTIGIGVGDNSIVANCLINGASEGGISVVGSGCSILNNNCANCMGAFLNFSAISVFGANNRIEGNHVTGASPGGYGIVINLSAGDTNNIIIKNSVEGGATDYSFNASQIAGPIINGTAVGIITNSNPWANFAF